MVVDKWLPIATSALGPKDDLVVGLNENRALCKLGTKLIWTAAWRTMNDILAMKRRVYGKRHPKTLQTEGNMLKRRKVHRRVFDGKGTRWFSWRASCPRNRRMGLSFSLTVVSV